MSDVDALVPRRQWLITAARYLTLSGLGLLVWEMIVRSGRACPRITSPCHQCQLLAHCRLPRAQVARNEAGIDS